MDAHPDLDPADLPRFYAFVVWMTGDRAAAVATAAEIVEAAPGEGFAEWAMALLAQLGGSKGRVSDRQMVLASLDELLRTDSTIRVSDQPGHLHVLQWELKRSCLFSLMRAVSPAPRAVFVLHAILGYSSDQIGAILGISHNAVGVHLYRAEKAFDGYLGARCQHMAPGNPCRCESRLGVALARGFVGWPEHADTMPDAPVYTGKAADIVSVYASLPAFDPDRSALDRLNAARGHNMDIAR